MNPDEIKKQILDGAIIKDGKVQWKGRVEDYFLLFVVVSNKEWLDVAKWMEFDKHNIVRLTSTVHNRTYNPWIGIDTIDAFFKNLPSRYMAAANKALDPNLRQRVAAHFKKLGYEDVPASSYVMWGLPNLRKLEDFSRRINITLKYLVPSGFGSSSPLRSHERLKGKPRRIRLLTLYRMAYLMETALTSSYIEKNLVQQRLGGEKAKDIFYSIVGDAERIPVKVTWTANAQDVVGGIQHKFGLSDREITVAMGYQKSSRMKYGRSVNSSRIGDSIDIDRVISLSVFLASLKDSAEEMFGSLCKENGSISIICSRNRLQKQANKKIDISGLSVRSAKILSSLFPEDIPVDSGTIPAAIQWGSIGSERIKSAMRELGMRQIPSGLPIVTKKQIYKLQLRRPQLTVQASTLIQIASQLSRHI